MGRAMTSQGIQRVVDLLLVAKAAFGSGFQPVQIIVAESVVGEKTVQIASGNQPVRRDGAVGPFSDPEQRGRCRGPPGRADVHFIARDGQAALDVGAGHRFERLVARQAGFDIE